MKLALEDAREICKLENTDAGLPVRGVHLRRDGSPGTEPGARYVDLDAKPDPVTGDRAGWSMRVREVSDELPKELVAEKVAKLKDAAMKRRVEDELVKQPKAKAEAKA